MFEWFYKLFVPTENPDITQSLVVVMLVIGIGVFIGRLKIGKISLGVSALILFVYGSFITLVPLLFMTLVGHFYIKINFLKLIGLMSGAYTDPAALSFSTNYCDSDVPTQSYATTYPLVTLFRIFTAQFLILLLMK